MKILSHQELRGLYNILFRARRNIEMRRDTYVCDAIMGACRESGLRQNSEQEQYLKLWIQKMLGLYPRSAERILTLAIWLRECHGILWADMSYDTLNALRMRWLDWMMKQLQDEMEAMAAS